MPGHTPSALGHRPSAFAKGARKKGKDGRMYTVSVTKTGAKRWTLGSTAKSKTTSKRTSKNTQRAKPKPRVRRRSHSSSDARALSIAKRQARRRADTRRAKAKAPVADEDTAQKLKDMLVGERVRTEEPLSAAQEKRYTVVRVPRATPFTYERVSPNDWEKKSVATPTGWDRAARAMRQDAADRHVKRPFAYLDKRKSTTTLRKGGRFKSTAWDKTPAEKRQALRRADRRAWHKSSARDHGTPRYPHAKASDIQLAQKIVKTLNKHDLNVARLYASSRRTLDAENSSKLMKTHASRWAVQEADVRRVRDHEKNRAYAMIISENGAPWKVVKLAPFSPYITDEIEQRHSSGWRGIVYGRYKDRAYIVDPELWSEVESMTADAREEAGLKSSTRRRPTFSSNRERQRYFARKDEKTPLYERHLRNKQAVDDE
jgi:hypothetical protein